MKLKKITILILVIMFCFSLICCKNEQKKQMVYHEAKLELPCKMNTIFKMNMVKDNNFMLVGYDVNNKIKCLVSNNNGKKFEQREIKNVDVIENQYISDVAISNTGNIAIEFGRIDGGQSQIQIVKEDGNKIDLNNLVGNGQMLFSDNGDLFVRTVDNIVQVNSANGQIKRKYSANSAIDTFYVWKNLLYVQANHDLQVYNINSYSKIKSQKSTMSFNLAFNSKNNREIYLFNENNIYSYDTNDNKSKLKVNGRLVNLCDENKLPVAAIYNGDNEFIVAYTNGELCRYYGKYEKVKKTNTVTIYSLYKKEYIQEMVNSYNKKHKNINVNYEYSIDTKEKNAMTVVDAKKQVNIEIKSGNGPDIIILDDLPIDSYIKQGCLDDLSTVYNSVKDKLFDNLVEKNMTGNKRLYYIPFTFKIPMIVGNNISSVNDLESLNKTVQQNKNTNKRLMNIESAEELATFLYSVYGDDLIDSNRKINTNKLESFLKNSKEIYESLGINNKMNTDEKKSETELLYRTGFYRYFNTDKEASIEIGCYASVLDDSALDYLHNKIKINSNLLCNDGKMIYFPMDMLSINSNSKNKNNAKKFIESILSMKADPKNNTSDILCINKEMYQNGLIRASSSDGVFINNDVPIVYSGEKYSEQQIIEREKKVEELNHPIVVDTQAFDLMKNEICSYISGEESIDNAINKIKNNLQIYLSE